MNTLLLPARYTPDSIALSAAAVEAGWEVERLGSWHATPRLRHSQVALYGEPIFGAVIARELSLVLIEPPLEWLARIPGKYLLREVRFTTLQQAKAFASRAFFKPADDKCFAAGVYEDGSALPVSEAVPGDTPALISEPVVWDVEFRFFVLDRRIRTYSCYARGEAAAAASEIGEALDFGAALLADPAVRIPPAVAIDVGRIERRGWAVVEANAAWASGIYQCDPREVLEVVARACVRNREAGPEDRRWVVDRTGRA